MSVTARATAIFDADDGKLAETAKRIDERLAELSERFDKLKESAIGIFIIDKLPEIYEKVAEGIKQVLEVGDHFHGLAANTGIAVEQLIVLEEEFRSVGVAAESLPGIIGHMQRVLTDGLDNRLVADLGVDLDELRKKTPIEQFHALGKAINELKNPNDRATAAMALFGKEGHDLLALFHEEGFGDAAERVGEQAQILAEDAALFADASIKLGSAGMKARGFFVGLADEVVPMLMPLLDRFEKLDAAHLGQSTGKSLNALIGGNPAQTIVAALMTSAAQFVEFFIDGILTAAGNFGLLMESVADVFIAKLLHGLATFLEKVSHVPGLGYLGRNASESTEDTANSLDQRIQKNSKSFGWIHSGIMDDAIDKFQETLSEDVGDALGEATAKHAEALKKHPELADEMGEPELQLYQPNVSHLASIGGASGMFSGSDPLIEANNIAREHSELLRTIAANTAPGAKATKAPAKHPE